MNWVDCSVIGLAIIAWLVLPLWRRWEHKRMVHKNYLARQAQRKLNHFKALTGGE